MVGSAFMGILIASSIDTVGGDVIWMLDCKCVNL